MTNTTGRPSDQATDGRADPGRPFSAARRAGDWIAVSGQLGVRDGHLVRGGAKAETSEALTNLRVVLADLDASLASVQKVNVYLTSMQDYADMNAAYADAFDGHTLPARTAVAVAALPRGASVEIEAWAYAPTADGGAR